ncbi:sensory box histidine kinase [Vibrio ponticus]|nr:sensory box histidine kinase [Vibrio ponticus]
MSSNQIDTSIAQGIAGAQVLLVEDNEINQQIALELLSLIGLEVATASNGQEAVDKVLAHPFDLVLMDIQMPVMDGYQATRTIRNTGKYDSLPIIAMTANAMSGDREKCLEAGMNAHLPKPINPNQVFQALADWIAPTGQTVEASVHASDDDNFVIEGLDTQSALARMGGNTKAYQKTLRNVVQSEVDVAQRISNAVEQGDIDTAVIAVHSLKGIAGNIGANYLVEPAQKLEHTLTEQKNQQRCELGKAEKEMIAEIDTLVKKMISAITQALSSSEQAPAKHNFDAVKFQQLATQLYSQLDDYDSAAVDTFDEMMASSGATVNPDLAKQASSAIANYDFEAALPLIKQLQQEIKV